MIRLNNNFQDIRLYDPTLLILILLLISFGFIMIVSTSISESINISKNSFYFINHSIFYVFLGFIISLIVLKIPIFFWKDLNLLIILITLFMLIFVLFSGHKVHGSSRWISLGFFNIQPSELTKLSLILHLSVYLSKNIDLISKNLNVLLNPILITSTFIVLLLFQPDIGSSLILFITLIIILFLTGTKITNILIILLLFTLISTLSILLKPYSLKRIVSFWNPWNDPFNSGYQLTQSLIAIGNGSLLGQGLGNSIYKMNYLPEAHTDFIFAIIGEELGYIGLIILLIIILTLILKALYIGIESIKINQIFPGFLAYSIGVYFSCQAFIHIGVTTGLIPTKGLTLPLISYGGSNFIIMIIKMSLLIRIDFETRIFKKYQYKNYYK